VLSGCLIKSFLSRKKRRCGVLARSGPSPTETWSRIRELHNVMGKSSERVEGRKIMRVGGG
jgi:hypothetical protein